MGPGPTADLSLHHFPMDPICLEGTQDTCVSGEGRGLERHHGRGKAVAALGQEQVLLQGRTEEREAIHVWGLGTLLVAPQAVTDGN